MTLASRAGKHWHKDTVFTPSQHLNQALGNPALPPDPLSLSRVRSQVIWPPDMLRTLTALWASSYGLGGVSPAYITLIYLTVIKSIPYKF